MTPREAAHVAALAAWVAGDFGGATACWESIAADHPRDVQALKLAQYAGSILEIANGCATCWGAPSPPGTQVCRATVLFSAAMPSLWRTRAITVRRERVGREAVERKPGRHLSRPRRRACLGDDRPAARGCCLG